MKNNGKAILLKSALMLLLLTLVNQIPAVACEACQKQQPKILRGFAHGTGPDSNWDYLIVAVMVAITIYVLVATLKCLFRPAEKSEAHIKRLILND
jgi:hypothetical protein